MQEIHIVAAGRTPIGTLQGDLAGLAATELGSLVIREILARGNIGASEVNEVIMGHVLTAGCGQNTARQAAVHAGLSFDTPAMTINKVCGSGLKAVHLAAQSILCGDADLVVAGGMESMSQSAHVLPHSRSGQKLGHWQALDTMLHDGLWDAFNQYHMGITAENLVEKYCISRDAQDEFALASQQKALAAIEAGRFDQEIVPVSIQPRKGDPITISRDQGPRPGSSLQGLGQLSPAFRKDGSVTAGNASGLNDGAAAVVCAAAARPSSWV